VRRFKENDDAKRVARNEERVTVVDEVAVIDRIALPKARAGKSMKLRRLSLKDR
jgi:hypothetical protein